MRLRAELLRFGRPDGGLDLLDPLLDRLHSLTPEQARQLEREPLPEALQTWLEERSLLEGPLAEIVRQQLWASKSRVRVEHPPVELVQAPPWELAHDLPLQVAPPWRTPEAWRRLAEGRAAGRAVLELPGFLEPEAWTGLAREASALTFEPLEPELDLGRAQRCLLAPGALPAWRDLVTSPALRGLVGAALGRALAETVTINAWCLEPGDHMRPHPDGARYAGTFSLGLNAGWRAAQGGAIAFGSPTAAGLDVTTRWLPHGGDLLLFAPHARSWHQVEPVQAGTRLTLTGWWSGP